jgi:type IV pilus assembly protein PilY1
VSVDGSTRIVVGTDGRPVPVKADLAKGVSLRLLNWREVPAVN